MFPDKIEKILDRNTNRIEALEEREARKLLKVYNRVRRELNERLMAIPSGTFTEAQIKSRLLQIESGISVLNQEVESHLSNGYNNVSEQGFEDSVREVNIMENNFLGVSNAIDIDLILDAVEPRNYLFNKYRSSILAYNESMRNSFTTIISDGLTANKTWSQVVGDMNNAFNLNEYKVARIVRTELHNIYNVSKMDGFMESKKKFLPDLKKALFHPIDSRTGNDSKEAKSQIRSVDIDKPFEYSYNGKQVVFMNPPDRPNDRAILIPWREEYAKV